MDREEVRKVAGVVLRAMVAPETLSQEDKDILEKEVAWVHVQPSHDVCDHCGRKCDMNLFACFVCQKYTCPDCGKYVADIADPHEGWWLCKKDIWI